MKTLGWILAIFGGLSFLGAALSGTSAIGPCFFIALGILIIHRSGQQTEENPHKTVQGKAQCKPSTHVPPHTDNISDCRKTINQINSELTTSQRESAMCLIALFGGFCDDYNDEEKVRFISKNAATFFGFNFSAKEMAFVLSKHSNIDSILNEIKTIRQKNAIEFILLSCHDLTNISKKSQAQQLLKILIEEIGYDNPSFNKLVQVYS